MPSERGRDLLLLGRPSRLDTARQLLGRPLAPEMEEHDARLLVRHMRVDGNDVAAHVLTPISDPSSSPCAFVRFANTNLAIPSFAWALPPRMTSSGCASMVFSAGIAGPPKPS